MFFKGFLFVVIASVLTSVMACSQQTDQTAEKSKPAKAVSAKEDILAVIEGEEVTLREFADHVRNLPFKMRREINGRQGKVKALDDFINEKLLYREALSRGIDNRPSIMEELEKIKRGLILRAFAQELLQEGIEIGDEEIAAYFKEHKHEYDKPERVRVSHILVSDKDLAETLRNQILGGESFRTLAKEHSIDKRTNYKWGDLGYIEKGRMPALFDDTAFSMKKEGEISKVIKTNMGYHILKFDSKVDAFDSSLSPSIEANIKRKIKQRKQKEFISSYTADLKSKFNVVTNESVLDSFVVPRSSDGHGGSMTTRGGRGH